MRMTAFIVTGFRCESKKNHGEKSKKCCRARQEKVRSGKLTRSSLKDLQNRGLLLAKKGRCASSSSPLRHRTFERERELPQKELIRQIVFPTMFETLSNLNRVSFSTPEKGSTSVKKDPLSLSMIFCAAPLV